MSDERHMNDSTMPLPKRKPSTGNPRVKRGFGLADWTRLVRSSKDLAQRKGEEIRRNISREEVAKHDKEYDGWVIVHGKVYNIGPYLHYHPGGLAILKPCLGKDATGLFEKYHRWVNVEG
jgi:cytochrome-b5 reductase